MKEIKKIAMPAKFLMRAGMRIKEFILFGLIEALVERPIRRGMTLLTTNEIAELADFWARSLSNNATFILNESVSEINFVKKSCDHTPLIRDHP